MDFRRPHTRLDTFQQKAPFISEPKKLIFSKVQEEKTPPACATISPAFATSSSSPHPNVAHFIVLDRKIPTYPASSPSTQNLVVSTQLPQLNINPPPLIWKALPGFLLNKYAPLDLP